MKRPLPIERAALLLLLLAACGGPPPAPPSPPPIATPDQDPTPVQVPVQPLPPLPADTVHPLRRIDLPNGMTAFWRYDRSGDGMTEILLSIDAGARSQRPGTAELALEVMLEHSDSSTGKLPLRSAIAALGGDLQAELGPDTTLVGIRVPHAQVGPALDALALALTQPTGSRLHIERIRGQMLARLIDAFQHRPTTSVPARYLLGDRSPAAAIEALVDRDATDAIWFNDRWYRPERTLLSINSALDPAALTPLAANAFGTWRMPAATDQQVHHPDPEPGTGLYWVPSDAPTVRALLIWALPRRSEGLVTAHALLNCLTMDGLGGRLEQLLRQQQCAAALSATGVRCGQSSALVLELNDTPGVALQVWQAALGARQSLIDLPLTRSEWSFGCARAQVTVLQHWQSGLAELAELTMMTNRGQPSPVQELQQLDPETPPAVDVVRSFVSLPLRMVVIGGEPPAAAVGVQRIELLPANTLPGLAADTSVAEQAAAQWLELACRAVGGRDAVASVIGQRSVATVRSAGAPEVVDELAWSEESYRRSRRTLGGTVVTELRDGRWFESIGKQQIELSHAEVLVNRRQAARHPLHVLAGAVRGSLRLRAAASRNVGDRRIAILEVHGKGIERMRVHIDEQNGLLRTIECWETDSSGAPRHVVEQYGDYRWVEGLRVPFLKETESDEGGNRTVTAVETFEAIRSK